MSMANKTNEKRFDQEVAKGNLLHDMKLSIEEHFDLSDDVAWNNAELLVETIESVGFFDSELCGPFDETSDGQGDLCGMEFISPDLLLYMEVKLEEEGERQNSSEDIIQHQKCFFRMLCGAVERYFQAFKGEELAVSAPDAYRSICLLREMSVIHAPENQPVHPD